MAARQALRLCEATLGGQHRVSPATPRAALRAAEVPPLIAATLRRRLRLTREQETKR
jgi:hypothetical protein